MRADRYATDDPQAKEWQNFSSWMAEQELGPEYGEELLALLAEVSATFLNTITFCQNAHRRIDIRPGS